MQYRKIQKKHKNEIEKQTTLSNLLNSQVLDTCVYYKSRKSQEPIYITYRKKKKTEM